MMMLLGGALFLAGLLRQNYDPPAQTPIGAVMAVVGAMLMAIALLRRYRTR